MAQELGSSAGAGELALQQPAVACIRPRLVDDTDDGGAAHARMG
jgi:hypothetical protein